MNWDQVMYEDCYRVLVKDPDNPRFGQYVTYGRDLAENSAYPWGEISFYRLRLQMLVDRAGLDVRSNVFVVGAGFGFLIEAAIDAGANSWWGCDSSDFIWENMATEARPDVASRIMRADLIGSPLKTMLTQAGAPTKFDWVVTESVAESQSSPRFFPACNGLLGPGGAVVHMVTAPTPGNEEKPRKFTKYGFEWLSLDGWVTKNPNHTWINVDEY